MASNFYRSPVIGCTDAEGGQQCVCQQETHTEVPTSMKTYQCSQGQPSLKGATVFLRTPDNAQSTITIGCDMLGLKESMLVTLHSPSLMEDPPAKDFSLLSPLLPRES